VHAGTGVAGDGQASNFLPVKSMKLGITSEMTLVVGKRLQRHGFAPTMITATPCFEAIHALSTRQKAAVAADVQPRHK
jgi:hypothetical protein